MLVATNVANDARVLKEARTLVAAGHPVHVVGRDVPPDWEPPEGLTVSSAGGRSAFRRAPHEGPRGPLPAHLRAARWVLLPQHRNQTFRRWAAAALADARGRPADVVHAHDFTALEVGARLARERGVPLVYDSHELWSGLDRAGRPTPVQRRSERRTERRLGGAAALVITVSEGLAEELRRRFGWAHVVVVRNSFPALAGPAATAVPERPRGLVYAGRIGAERDLETVLAAAGSLAPLGVTLVGPADDGYLAGIDLRGVRHEAAVDVDEVDAILRREGLALVTLTERSANHRVALPNKLFQAVRAGVPVVATDLPEIRRVVTRHRVGMLYRAGDPRSLAAAVRSAVDGYPGLVASVAAASEALSWSSDAQVLLAAYDRLRTAAGP